SFPVTLPAHPDLHSFPTRRSSDLDPARRPPDPHRLVEEALGAKQLQSLGLDPLCRQPLTSRQVAEQFRPCRPSHQHVVNQLRVQDRKSTRLNSSHVKISYAVFCLK